MHFTESWYQPSLFGMGGKFSSKISVNTQVRPVLLFAD